MALAGVWSEGKCAILTTTPNSTVAVVHDRMPLILPPERFDLWLDDKVSGYNNLAELLAPAPEGLLTCYMVDKRVNRVGIDEPTLIERVHLPEQQTLF